MLWSIPWEFLLQVKVTDANASDSQKCLRSTGGGLVSVWLYSTVVGWRCLPGKFGVMVVESISMSVRNGNQLKGNRLSSPTKRWIVERTLFLVGLISTLKLGLWMEQSALGEHHLYCYDSIDAEVNLISFKQILRIVGPCYFSFMEHCWKEWKENSS